jgi:hypothetical protein
MGGRSRALTVTGGILVVLCTAAIYWETVSVPPLDYEDSFYLVHSPYVHVSNAFTRLGPVWNEPYFANFHPVTTSTWLLDRALADKSRPFDDRPFRTSHLFYAALGACLLIPLYRRLGTAAGIVGTIAIGGGMGAEAAEANAGEEGFEFSHWIPNRMGGPRSIYNGNYVSQELHYLTDVFRYPSGWQAFGPKLPAVAQQLLRIPWVYDGAAAGAAWGGAGAMAGRNCGCH